MFRKTLSVLVVLCLVFSMVVVSHVSAASDKKFEVVQDFEKVKEGDFGVIAGGNTVAAVSGANAIYGKGAVSITAGNADWTMDFISASLPQPTITNPKGVFFRIETNQKADSSIRISLSSPKDAGAWAGWTADDGSGGDAAKAIRTVAAFVSDDGVVSYGRTPTDKFSGYVFIPVDPDKYADINADNAKSLCILLAPWYGNVWKGLTTVFDNIGYYNTTTVKADQEYKDIVSALNAVYTPNPVELNSISTGTFQNNVMVSTPTQMSVSGIHIQKVIWSVSNTNVATIDPNTGILTGKKIGKVTVTATSASDDSISTSTSVFVKKAYISTTSDVIGGVDGTEAATISGVKPEITAKVNYLGYDNSVEWTVLKDSSGKVSATIKDLDEGNEDAPSSIEHKCWVTFKNSGKVTIRVTLKEDPKTFTDFTFTVSADSSKLQELVYEAQFTTGNYAKERVDALNKAIDSANKLLDNEKATQAQLDAAQTKLQIAIDNLKVPVKTTKK